MTSKIPIGMEIQKHKEKAFDAALDMVKQLITIASSIIVLSITFLKDVLNVEHPQTSETHWSLYVSWITMLLSIILGMLAHGAITGTLDQLTPDEPSTVTIYKGNIKFFVQVQWCLFLLGILFMLIYGMIKL